MRIACALVLVALGSAMAAEVDEEKASLSRTDIPEAVVKAFEASQAGVAAAAYDSETVAGVRYYEVKTANGELEKDFIYLADGTLEQVEEQISVPSLPGSIADAVKKAHPQASIEEAFKIVRGGVTSYELDCEEGESDFELLVSSDGQIKSSTESGEDEDEATDDDEDSEGADEGEDESGEDDD